MNMPSECNLCDAIIDAMRNAVNDLFTNNPEHHFYYISLITTGEAHAPSLSAWSIEALEEAIKNSTDTEILDLKWSYANSPFFPVGDQYFEDVRHLFDKRPTMDPNDDDQWSAEYELRLRSMEKAVLELDKEGLFGFGDTRQKTVVNVEVMPPDETNTSRAKRLNSESCLREWLSEAAE